VNEDDVLDQRRACRMREDGGDGQGGSERKRPSCDENFIFCSEGICRMGGKLNVTSKIILLVGW
jgi:hypothetical protein